MKYLILQNPGHNRVYYQASDKMAMAELALAASRFSTDCVGLDVVEIAGVRYIAFETEAELVANDILLISRLSFVFAIFQRVSVEGKEMLLPVEKKAYEYLDGKVSSLLKYQGKTNELFTKMLVNIALLASDFNYDDSIRMLDPVAGKGTTLFEGAVYGFNAYGIEVESKYVHELQVFFKKYLQTERMKHHAQERPVYGKSKADSIQIHEFAYAKTKEEFKSNETTKMLGIIGGRAQDAHKYFKDEVIHILVGDLPYGIFHSNTGGKKLGGVTRNPLELLDESLEEWYQVLKPGGTAVVAWNSYVAPRDKVADLFIQHGFEVQIGPPFEEFEHMVDKSIKRDVIVARKEHLAGEIISSDWE